MQTNMIQHIHRGCTAAAPLRLGLALAAAGLTLASTVRADTVTDWNANAEQAILTWRSTNGATTPMAPYFGGGAPGIWRSPPAGTNADGTLPALFPQYSVLVPFAMTSHDQFRPGPPPALTSALYAADVNEAKAIGRFDSAVRTAEQTQLALLWQAVGPVEENRSVRPVIEAHARHGRLVDTARMLALLNIAFADALVAGFDCKYTYNLWRPYHAVRLADADGNPDTDADPTWDSLFTAPRHQEYMSNQGLDKGFDRGLDQGLD